MTCGHSTWSTFAAWFSAGALRDSGSRVLVGHNGNGLLLYTSYVLHVGFSVPWHTRPSGAVAIAGQGQAGEYCEPPASHLPWLCLPHDRLANQCKCRRRPGPQLAFQRVQTTSRALNKCRCDRQETLGGPPPAPPSQGKPMPTITGLRCVLERRPWWRRGVCPGGWGSHQVTAKTLETPPPRVCGQYGDGVSPVVHHYLGQAASSLRGWRVTHRRRQPWPPRARLLVPAREIPNPAGESTAEASLCHGRAWPAREASESGASPLLTSTPRGNTPSLPRPSPEARRPSLARDAPACGRRSEGGGGGTGQPRVSPGPGEGWAALPRARCGVGAEGWGSSSPQTARGTRDPETPLWPRLRAPRL